MASLHTLCGAQVGTGLSEEQYTRLGQRWWLEAAERYYYTLAAREFVDLSETFPGPFLGTTRSRRGSSWRRCGSSTALCQSSLLPWLLDSAGRCWWTCPLLAAETTCGLQRRLAGRRCGAGLGGSGWLWTEQRGRGSATLRTRAARSAGAAWRGRGGDLAEIAPRSRRDCVLAERWPALAAQRGGMRLGPAPSSRYAVAGRAAASISSHLGREQVARRNRRRLRL